MTSGFPLADNSHAHSSELLRCRLVNCWAVLVAPTHCSPASVSSASVAAAAAMAPQRLIACLLIRGVLLQGLLLIFRLVVAPLWALLMLVASVVCVLFGPTSIVVIRAHAAASHALLSATSSHAPHGAIAS